MEPTNPCSQPSSHPAAATNVMSDGQQLYLLNSKTNMSSLNPPKLYFPEQLPSPTSLPIRPPPQFPKLDELDKIYGKFHPPIEIVGHQQEAFNALYKHIDARQKYVEFASARLQAAVGVRNEAPFDLPLLPKRKLSPSMQGLYNMPKADFASSGTDKGGMKAKSHARGGRRESGIGLVPKSPVGMQSVDKKTGKGLREFLLQKGKECGMRKQECKSITFHDFTPDMRTGQHQNVMLGHYAAEMGERVDVYEVDLPATQRNEITGEEFPTTETWLWILMTRPLVSIDLKDASTYVALNPPSVNAPVTDVFSTPQSTAFSPEPIIKPTPPNFPRPAPLSWCVFAAPKAHVTTYPETVETHDRDGSIATYPFATPSATIRKRIDYDFSFSGIPLFEFSSADKFFIGRRRSEFLSIEQMGGFYEHDLYAPYANEEYMRHCRLWEDGEWPPGKWSGTSKSSRYYEDGTPKGSMPSPNRGVWWKNFYERMAKDVERWKKIKTAMGRGKCRVVVRWIEAPEDESMEKEHVDVSAKQDGGAGGKKGPQGKRKMRSEARRRSGLGASEPPVGLAIGSVFDSGEGSKTRAVGSRELGRAGGGVVDKEKAKVRNR